mmetsp:Transcript_25210/g.58004  ORF Transcript_25210/g.58004 Transcript_25210/m.58004 type:complete len:243 (+) Transcript_25210:600-1328(+)
MGLRRLQESKAVPSAELHAPWLVRQSPNYIVDVQANADGPCVLIKPANRLHDAQSSSTLQGKLHKSADVFSNDVMHNFAVWQRRWGWHRRCRYQQHRQYHTIPLFTLSTLDIASPCVISFLLSSLHLLILFFQSLPQCPWILGGNERLNQHIHALSRCDGCTTHCAHAPVPQGLLQTRSTEGVAASNGDGLNEELHANAAFELLRYILLTLIFHLVGIVYFCCRHAQGLFHHRASWPSMTQL